jgi:16S rRNA (cytidine1402-2'-O)-methyltransferase
MSKKPKKPAAKTPSSPAPKDKASAGGLQPALYLVATPIGHAKDITLRALEVLKAADFVFCEDTRQTQKLLMMHGITGKKLQPAHEHNERGAAEQIAQKIAQGKSVAYASDAGLPLISDPGAIIVQKIVEEGYRVESIPGANAALTALQLSALPALPFYFAGFLPPKTHARKKAIEALKPLAATLLFYEAPHRLIETLEDLAGVLGSRNASVSREITKLHEETLRGELPQLLKNFKSRPSIKGECVIVVQGFGSTDEHAMDQAEIDRLLIEARKTLSAREAAVIMAGKTGLPKRELYQRLLHLNDPTAAKRK